ncbi:MAG TPA: hypothetical protein VG942_19535 [Hyphomonadaceae bacterium]|nr:hypothetical protein [Hyphomonadaceae bacterium]
MDGSSFSSSITTTAGLSVPMIVRPKKAYAMAFAAFALVLAGCASGFGANSQEASVNFVSRVEDGAVLASTPVGANPAAPTGFLYTVRLSSGELISLAQDGRPAIADGVPVVVEYGHVTRIVPQAAALVGAA